MCTYLCLFKYINNCGMIYSWFVLHKIIFVEVHLWLVETLCCRAIGSKFYVFQVHRLLFPWFILSLKVIILRDCLTRWVWLLMTQMDFKNADIHSFPFLMKMCVFNCTIIYAKTVHKVTLHGYKFFFEGGGGSQVLLTPDIFALITIF